MNKPRTGLVAVASPFESGGQRAEELVASVEKALGASGVEVVRAHKVAWDCADAIAVCQQFKEAGIESLIVIDITWVTDSMKYLFVNELRLPVLFWAVPYTETFSIGCIQHFGSILKAQSIPYDYVYGLADTKEAVAKARRFAQAGQIIKAVCGMRLALLGPRQTWRVAGPQDMTNEEWEFSRKFGTTLVHIEMDELTEIMGKISDGEGEKTLKTLESRTGKTLADKETMIHMAKAYMATKELISRYSLDAIAAECYPQFSGLMNLTSSWLADEGVIIDTEGDIGHTVVMYMLNMCAGGGATALGEVGSFAGDIMEIAHEGSTAHSLAADLGKVQISPSGDKGCFVGLPLKPMPSVTVSSMVGSAGCYKLLVARGDTLEATHQEWLDGGSKLLVKLRVGSDGGKAVDAMMQAGLDHHLLIKEGDHTQLLSMLCAYMGLEQVTL